MITIGIDVGATGGVAIFGDERLVAVEPMPNYTHYKKNGGNKKLVHATALAHILKPYISAYPGEVTAFIEQVNSTPQMGLVSCASFMEAKGTIIGVLGALEIPFQEVSPQVWKASAGIKVVGAQTMPAAKVRSIAKDMARTKVIQLFPEQADKFTLKKSADMAESVLIGLYGLKTTKE